MNCWVHGDETIVMAPLENRNDYPIQSAFATAPLTVGVGITIVSMIIRRGDHSNIRQE